MSYHASYHQRLTSHAETKPIVPVIDAHLHLVDFIQETDGIPRLLAAMDAGNVAKAVIFGLPVKKKWETFEKHPPHYYLDDNSRCYYFPQTDDILAVQLLALPPRLRQRFAPLACGFNPTDRHAVRDLERTLDRYPFWRGVGEIFCRHDDLTNLTNEEVARMNHPALLEVYDLCAQRRLPVLVHHNSTSVNIHDEYEYLDELEEPLDRCPQTTFVWAHCGISRRVFHKTYHAIVSQLLKRHENLFIDVSWIVYDDIICADLQPKQHWLDLITRHANRVCLGSDLCGHFDHLPQTMARYNALLRQLPPRARRLVARENAERLWFPHPTRR